MNTEKDRKRDGRKAEKNPEKPDKKGFYKRQERERDTVKGRQKRNRNRQEERKQKER